MKRSYPPPPEVSVQGLCFSYGEGGAVRLDELSLGCSARRKAVNCHVSRAPNT